MLCTLCMSAIFDTTWQHYIELLPGPFDCDYNIFIAEPEGEATNLDAQVTERLYICIFFFICIYVRHSQLRTPRSWPQNCICSYS